MTLRHRAISGLIGLGATAAACVIVALVPVHADPSPDAPQNPAVTSSMRTVTVGGTTVLMVTSSPMPTITKTTDVPITRPWRITGFAGVPPPSSN